MGLFKKFAGFLGLGNGDDVMDNSNAHKSNSDDFRYNRMNIDPFPAGPRRGFSVPVKIPVDRPVIGPVLVPCCGDGGVQGLRWYITRLKTDEDGDVADEFLIEASPDTSVSIPQEHAKPSPRFQVTNNTRHAKIKQQAMTQDGKLQHCVENQGQLQWV